MLRTARSGGSFKDVVLGGLLPDGQADPDFRGVRRPPPRRRSLDNKG